MVQSADRPWRVVASRGRPLKWVVAYFETRELAREQADWFRARGWYSGVDRRDPRLHPR
jgi:hypothetical protein